MEGTPARSVLPKGKCYTKDYFVAVNGISPAIWVVSRADAGTRSVRHSSADLLREASTRFITSKCLSVQDEKDDSQCVCLFGFLPGAQRFSGFSNFRLFWAFFIRHLYQYCMNDHTGN